MESAMDINYISTFLGRLNKFRKTSTLCDVTLRCEEKTLYCHWCVLASVCPITHHLLESHSYRENVVITLPPCFKEILDELMNMLYTGEFHIASSNIEIICKFSIYMEIHGLQEICFNYIKANKPNNLKPIKEIEDEVKMLPKLIFTEPNSRRMKSRRKKLNKDFIYFNDNFEDKELMKDAEFTENTTEFGKEFSNLTQVASEAYEDLKTKKTLNQQLLAYIPHHVDSILKNAITFESNANEITEKNKKNGKHQCPHCEIFFQRKATMELHLKRTHTKIRPFQCPDCSKAFYLKRELKVHIRIHTNGHAFKCEECDKTFTTNEGFKRHFLHVHGPNTHHCNNEGCDFVCSASIQLERHQLKCELGQQDPPLKRHKCHICHATFRWPHVMRRHVSSVHMQHRPYKCDTCDLAFNRKEQLREHTASHTHMKNYKCEVCGKSFRQQSGLCVHKKIHQNMDNIVCEICGHKYRSVSALKVHHDVHLVERPFSCEQCNKTFKSTRQLKNHERSQHRKSKPKEEIIGQDSIPSKTLTENKLPQPCGSEPLLQPLQLVVATPDNFFTQIQQNATPLLQCFNADDGNISAYFNNAQPQFTTFSKIDEQ